MRGWRSAAFVAWIHGLLVDVGNRRGGGKGGRGRSAGQASSGTRHWAAVVNPVGVLWGPSLTRRAVMGGWRSAALVAWRHGLRLGGFKRD
jgi:hypothetical protein